MWHRSTSLHALQHFNCIYCTCTYSGTPLAQNLWAKQFSLCYQEFCVIRFLKHTKPVKGTCTSVCVIRIFVLSGAWNIQNQWKGHAHRFVLSGFLCYQVLETCNQWKGHAHQFVLSGFLCYQVLETYKISERDMHISLCYQDFCVIRFLKHTISERDMHISLCYQDFCVIRCLKHTKSVKGTCTLVCVIRIFVLSDAWNIQNQWKGHAHQYVLSGFSCSQNCVKWVPLYIFLQNNVRFNSA